MRYSTEPKFRKYVEGYSFLSFVFWSEIKKLIKLLHWAKQKVKKKKTKDKKSTYHKKKDSRLLWLEIAWYHIKMEYQKITNLLGATLDEVPKCIAKKWIEVYDQSGSAEDRNKASKQIRFKTSMLRSDVCDFKDAYIVVKGIITFTNPNNDAYDKKLA